MLRIFLGKVNMNKLSALFLALFMVFLLVTLAALSSYISARASKHYHSGVDQFTIIVLLAVTVIFLTAFIATRKRT